MAGTITQSKARELHFNTWEQDEFTAVNMIEGQKTIPFTFNMNGKTPPIILSHKDEQNFIVLIDDFEKDHIAQTIQTPMIDKCEQNTNDDDKFGQLILISGTNSINKPISDLTNHQYDEEYEEENELIRPYGDPQMFGLGFFSDTDVEEEGVVEYNLSIPTVETSVGNVSKKTNSKTKKEKSEKRLKTSSFKEKQKQTNIPKPKPKRESAKILTTEIVNQSDTTEHTKEKKRTFSRHTKDEIVRVFFCNVKGCEHGYGTSSALRIHMQRKHPFLKHNNVPLSSLTSAFTPSTNNNNNNNTTNTNNDETVLCTPKSEQIEQLVGDIAKELLFNNDATLQEAIGIVTQSAELIPVPEGTPLSTQINTTQRMHRIIEQTCCFCGFLEGQGRFQEFAFPLYSFSIGGGKWLMESNHPKDIILILSPYLLTLTIETKSFLSVNRFVLNMATIIDWLVMRENDSIVTFSVTYSKRPEFFRYSENDKNKHKGFRNCEDFTEGIASNFARHEYTFEQSFSNFFNEVFFACRTHNY